MLQQIRQQVTLAAVAVVVLTSSSMAQFAGNAVFSTLPFSQINNAPVVNNLIITNTPNGFTVTGDATVPMAAAPPTATGILVEWVIDRPLASNFTFTNWTTTTSLAGFSQPPAGVRGNTSGAVTTEFTEPGMQGPSLSSLPMTLTNGLANWPPPVPNTSSTFSGATPALPTYFLRQHFFLDGTYLNGPGGNWVIDVPVDSFITQVPEPATLGIVSTFGFALLMRRSRVRHARA